MQTLWTYVFNYLALPYVKMQEVIVDIIHFTVRQAEKKSVLWGKQTNQP